MVQKTLALSAAALILVGAAFASPDKDKKKKETKPAAKLIMINTCPITGEDAKSAAGGSSVVGKYKVNFCCAGCKPSFDKMSKEDKDKKLAELAKKQGNESSGGKKAS